MDPLTHWSQMIVNDFLSPSNAPKEWIMELVYFNRESEEERLSHKAPPCVSGFSKSFLGSKAAE